MRLVNTHIGILLNAQTPNSSCFKLKLNLLYTNLYCIQNVFQWFWKIYCLLNQIRSRALIAWAPLSGEKAYRVEFLGLKIL